LKYFVDQFEDLGRVVKRARVVCLLFDDSASDTARITALPPGLSAASNDQSNWVDITIACPPPPPPEININLIAIIVLIIAWAGYGGYLVRKRRGSGKKVEHVEQDTTKDDPTLD